MAGRKSVSLVDEDAKNKYFITLGDSDDKNVNNIAIVIHKF